MSIAEKVEILDLPESPEAKHHSYQKLANMHNFDDCAMKDI